MIDLLGARVAAPFAAAAAAARMLALAVAAARRRWRPRPGVAARRGGRGHGWRRRRRTLHDLLALVAVALRQRQLVGPAGHGKLAEELVCQRVVGAHPS